MIAWVLAAMILLAPGRDHTPLASAIASTVTAKGCLVRGDNCERRTAAIFIAVSFYESAFRIDAKGKTSDCGAFQHVTGDRAECDRLRTDVVYAASVAHDDLAASLRCGKGRELNRYATGSCSKGGDITRGRMALAAKIARSK